MVTTMKPGPELDALIARKLWEKDHKITKSTVGMKIKTHRLYLG
jgi:hypothetical protein